MANGIDFFTDEGDSPTPVSDERSLGRRIALQILYEVDVARHNPMDVIDIHQRSQNPSRRASRYMRQLVLGTWKQRELTDEAIRVYAPEYPLDQLAAIDRNILRMAIYEFAVSAITPVGAAIDEAVELAKQFGADGSPSFVNGVLGSLAEDEDMLTKLRQTDQPTDEEPGDDLQTET